MADAVTDSSGLHTVRGWTVGRTRRALADIEREMDEVRPHVFGADGAEQARRRYNDLAATRGQHILELDAIGLRPEPSGWPGVRIDREAARALAAFAVDSLWDDVQQSGGCYPCCCAPCSALARLADSGLLDDLVRPYAVTEAGDCADYWNADADMVDREFLTRAWTTLRCPFHTGLQDHTPGG